MPSFFRILLSSQHAKEKTHTLSMRREQFIEHAKRMDDLLNQLEFSYMDFIRQVNSGERS